MQTYSATDLRNMTEFQRRQVFLDLGAACYGTDKFYSKFARDSGWSRRTFHNWTNEGTPIPAAAILLLQEWSGRKTTPEILLKAVVSVSQDLEKVSRTLRLAAKEAAETLKEERTSSRFQHETPIEQLTEPFDDDAEIVPEPAAPEIDLSRL